MTNPAEPPTRERVFDRRDGLLRSIQQLAAQETQVQTAGDRTGEDPSGDQQRRRSYLAALEQLQRRREQVEQEALTAGIPAQVIADVREFGHSGTRPVPRRDMPARTLERENTIEALCQDMLTVELWDLQRMIGLEALRRDRIETGRWSFGNNPDAVRKYAANTHRQYQRVNALAAAVRLTATEAATLWDATAESLRRLHAVTFERLDELSVVAEWSKYAMASPKPARPPYVADDLDIAGVLADAGVSVPTPQQMLDLATTALRAHFIDATAEEDLDTCAIVTTAVEAALPEQTPRWSAELDDDRHTRESTRPDLGLES